MSPKTRVKPLATRKYSAARVSPLSAVVQKSLALSTSPQMVNAATGTPRTTTQNQRQNRGTGRPQATERPQRDWAERISGSL